MGGCRVPAPVHGHFYEVGIKESSMSRSIKALLATAALAGLLTGTSARLNAQSTDQKDDANKTTDSGKRAQDKDKQEKHACKGQNSCKGKGGCKAGDNGCKAKNSCKGKGGCATDGSKPPEG
jgi:hypothetical protein